MRSTERNATLSSESVWFIADFTLPLYIVLPRDMHQNDFWVPAPLESASCSSTPLHTAHNFRRELTVEAIVPGAVPSSIVHTTTPSWNLTIRSPRKHNAQCVPGRSFRHFYFCEHKSSSFLPTSILPGLRSKEKSTWRLSEWMVHRDEGIFTVIAKFRTSWSVRRLRRRLCSYPLPQENVIDELRPTIVLGRPHVESDLRTKLHLNDSGKRQLYLFARVPSKSSWITHKAEAKHAAQFFSDGSSWVSVFPKKVDLENFQSPNLTLASSDRSNQLSEIVRKSHSFRSFEVFEPIRNSQILFMSKPSLRNRCGTSHLFENYFYGVQRWSLVIAIR